MPVIPATLEAEAVESIEPGRWRLWDTVHRDYRDPSPNFLKHNSFLGRATGGVARFVGAPLLRPLGEQADGVGLRPQQRLGVKVSSRIRVDICYAALLVLPSLGEKLC
ncbi:hypothetical protein AAY473_021141 [Plecturocebus cupreus]